MPLAVDEVLDHLSGLPPFPKVTVKLLAMLDDDTISVDELSKVISADPSLVLKVLHLANSPFYMVSKPVESVKEAVLVLGINTIKSITTAASIQKGLASVRPRTDAFDMLAHWRHSYATAIAASKLSRKIDPRLSDTLYVTGLIHDIGKVILAYYWPEVWRAIVHSVSVTHEPVEEVEQRLFQWTHRQIGAQLCRKWQFPDQMIDLISRLGLTCDPSHQTTIRLLTKAHRLATRAGFAFPGHELVPAGPCDDDADIGEISETLAVEVEYQLKVLES